MEDPFGSTPIKPGGPLHKQRSRLELAPPPLPLQQTTDQQDGSAASPELLTPDVTGTVLHERLKAMLDRNSGVLQTVAAMGLQLNTKQESIEEQIKSLGKEVDTDSEIGDDAKTKLRDLEDAMREFEIDKDDYLRTLNGAKVRILCLRARARVGPPRSTRPSARPPARPRALAHGGRRFAEPLSSSSCPKLPFQSAHHEPQVAPTARAP